MTVRAALTPGTIGPWRQVPPHIRLRDLLARAEAALGPDAVLDLEYELVTSLHCAACGAHETVNRPAVGMTSRVLVCPSCGRPTRTKHIVLESGARALVCRHCGEPYERVRKTEAQ